MSMDITPNNERQPSVELRSDAATPANEHIAFEKENLPTNRRRFLRDLACDCTTALSTVYLAKPHLKTSPPSTTDNQEEGDGREYPNTNTSTTFPSGRSFHNLGVWHTGLRYMLVRETIDRAIRQNDVVLLEGCAGQTYFDFVSAIAHQHGKVVLRLESSKSRIHDVGSSTSLVLSAWASIGNAYHFLVRGVCAGWDTTQFLYNRSQGIRDNVEWSEVDGASLKRTFFTLGVAMNHYMFGVSQHVMRWDREQEEYPTRDGSYTVDGRTVLMLKDIEKCVAEFPNLKVLAITGDLHAIGFTYYTSTPERYEAFQSRARWYERVYRSWLGGSPKIEHDPVLTGKETPPGT